ncbi:hypothetical protein [Pseudacidobacterium ailaaui]|uniref:hypothetical protein n=1 Tax=Pseudacidobacterium ailaaui TaxID=1382359 RepID=UPI0005D20F62|nr:hypothetical protein [Pseudacidobacterium ailaaui]
MAARWPQHPEKIDKTCLSGAVAPDYLACARSPSGALFLEILELIVDRWRWYHGTSAVHAKDILADGCLRPGMLSLYDEWLAPRPDAVYITSSLELAQAFAICHDEDGVVFEVSSPETVNLVPDEDSIREALMNGTVGGGDPYLAAEVRKFWMVAQEISIEDFNEALGSTVESLDAYEYSEFFHKIASAIALDKPSLALRIIVSSERAAHIGSLKILGTVPFLELASSQTRLRNLPMEEI